MRDELPVRPDDRKADAVRWGNTVADNTAILNNYLLPLDLLHRA
jgi:hypothetical protein